ncbi:MAG: 2Fe-2S iron-sulfur cluster binding domain-containing protein [Nevskia sp.]|nr:2Fe-2S iron-sulfur cluster binding domain-containing protein [Nevskia sp.]
MRHSVTLQPFGLSFDCAADETILAAAQRCGITLRYGCKHGKCGSCKARIAEGMVDQEGASEAALTGYERDAGLALLCSAYPVEDVVIELADGYREEELSSGPPIAEYSARLSGLRNLTQDIVLVRLDLQQPPAMAFNSGQYVEIEVPGTGSWRAFSMANPAGDDRHADLMIKLLPGGVASEYLRSRARIGDTVALRGPYGQFCLSLGTAPIVMVAGGSGMAPIASMLGWLARQGSRRPITFYYGARSVRDLFWGDELLALQQQLPALRYLPALSESGADDGWTGERGLVTEVLERDCGNLRGAEAYLCGPPPMIDAAIVVLRAKGMFSSRIRFDKFVSTGPNG